MTCCVCHRPATGSRSYRLPWGPQIIHRTCDRCRDRLHSITIQTGWQELR